MTRTAKEQKTVNYYDKQAQQWALEHGGSEEQSYWETELQVFKQLLPSGKVLEIGSGTGKDARALINMGYNYVGTDASKGLIEIAQKRNPQALFVNQAVEDLDFPKNSFDGFWTAATLLHIPKDQTDNALQKIRGVCKDGSIGFISLKQGGGEKEDQHTGRWFSYYSDGEFREALKRNTMEVMRFDTKNQNRAGEPYWLCFWVKV